MFQRLKGAIDARIAEEQARQKLAQQPVSTPPTRSSSLRRTVSSNTISPSRRARSRNQNGEPGTTPDPSEFDAEFVAADGDPDPLSEKSAVKSLADKVGSAVDEEKPNAQENALAAAGTMESGGEQAPQRGELSPVVMQKLRRLDFLENKFQSLLNAYRIAHSKVQKIEPFETALRENTPLTSIAEPTAMVEYLNQIQLKGDMVLQELKRVTTERDSFKQKLDEAETKAKDACDKLANLKGEAPDRENGASEDGNSHAPKHLVLPDGGKQPASTTSEHAKSPAIMAFAGNLFSPKPKNNDSEKVTGEDLFSYDDELPRLQSELNARQTEVENLQADINTLKTDLEVARESTASMAKNLEDATNNLNAIKDAKQKDQSSLKAREEELSTMSQKLDKALGEVQRLQDAKANLSSGRDEYLKEKEELLEEKKSLEMLLERMRHTQTIEQISRENEEKQKSAKRMDILTGVVNNLKGQLQESENKRDELESKLAEKKSSIGELQATVSRMEAELAAKITNEPTSIESETKTVPKTGGNGPSGGRKNRKKRKGAKQATQAKGESEQVRLAEPALSSDVAANEDEQSKASKISAEIEEKIRALEQEIEMLRAQVEEKQRALEIALNKQHNIDDLREEIEGLKDDLINVGQDHVDTKEKMKDLETEKNALAAKLEQVEKDLAETSAKYAEAVSSSEAQATLEAEHKALKIKESTLQTDLSAAHELAAGRFKQITDLRESLQKTQSELRLLRTENGELRGTKEELGQKCAELRRLEARHEDLKAEMTGLKKTLFERDAEVRTLNQKIEQEITNRLKAEQNLNSKISELRIAETKRQDAAEARDKNSRDLAQANEELRKCRTQIREFEEKVASLNRDIDGLRDELQLKTAQHASAQSLMNSMRDQTSELATQMKEARERCQSLQEELADAERLLNERSRESETMRRLLSDAEIRTESKMRDIREQMETAIEERDRAEADASNASRRRAREIEDMKTRAREAERNMKRLEEEKEELEIAQRDWRRRREELEAQEEQARRELQDGRQAMSELSKALDASEKQANELERQKEEFRKALEDSIARATKLQKQNKRLNEEMQLITKRERGSEVPSSRSSIEYSPSSRSLVGSPTPKQRSISRSLETMSIKSVTDVDSAYIKSILLQLMQQKDKKLRLQIVDALKRLLHFDAKEEQEWHAAVAAL